MYEWPGTFLSLAFPKFRLFRHSLPAITYTDILNALTVGQRLLLTRSIQCGMKMWSCTFHSFDARISIIENALLGLEILTLLLVCYSYSSF